MIEREKRSERMIKINNKNSCFQFDKNIISEAFAAAKLGIIVNSSINFLLYCMSGRRFRQEFLFVIGCVSRDRKGLLNSYSEGHTSSGTSGTSTTGI